MEDEDIMRENEIFHKNSSCEIFLNLFDDEPLEPLNEWNYLDFYFRNYKPKTKINIKSSKNDYYVITKKYEEKLREKYNINESPKKYFLTHFPNIFNCFGILCLYVIYFKKKMETPLFSFSLHEFILYRTNIYEMIDLLYEIKNMSYNEQNVLKILYDLGKSVDSKKYPDKISFETAFLIRHFNSLFLNKN